MAAIMAARTSAEGVLSFVDDLMEKSHTVDAMASLGRSIQDSAAIFGRASHPVLRVIAVVHISFVVARGACDGTHCCALRQQGTHVTECHPSLLQRCPIFCGPYAKTSRR